MERVIVRSPDLVIPPDTPQPCLWDLEMCALCSGTRRLEREHIFPQVAAKRHGVVLGELLEDKVNKIWLCRRDHTLIDRVKGGKAKAFFTGGLTGVSRWIGGYPRAEDPDFLKMQFDQWIKLFSLIKDNLDSLNGGISPMYRVDYDDAKLVLGKFIEHWRGVSFVEFIPLEVSKNS